MAAWSCCWCTSGTLMILSLGAAAVVAGKEKSAAVVVEVEVVMTTGIRWLAGDHLSTCLTYGWVLLLYADTTLEDLSFLTMRETR